MQCFYITNCTRTYLIKQIIQTFIQVLQVQQNHCASCLHAYLYLVDVATDLHGMQIDICFIHKHTHTYTYFTVYRLSQLFNLYTYLIADKQTVASVTFCHECSTYTTGTIIVRYNDDILVLYLSIVFVSWEAAAK